MGKTRNMAFAVHLLVITACVAVKGPRSRHLLDASSVNLEIDTPAASAALPSFLQGEAEDHQAHIYSDGVRVAGHIASGAGLHAATTGVPASFTIELVGDDEAYGQRANTSNVEVPVGLSGDTPADWRRTVDSARFIYVWISSEDQIMIAEVTPNEEDYNDDGRRFLTATYTSDFPGDYLVYVEEVFVSEHDEGRPIVGSPFALTITTDTSDGSAPTASTMDIRSLPVCGSEEDTRNDIADTFWRPGTWLSANVASPTHGVTRNGWVFQPQSCVFDAFSFDDLMLLADSDQEPTWLLVLGTSVQRGLFLTLVDMVLEQGQKDEMADSALQKCWGYADVRVGNLRLTYQDMRLSRMSTMEDSVVCNNEKLVSGSTSAFVRSCEQFLSSIIFPEGGEMWPSVIMAPSRLEQSKNASNLDVEVLMKALPRSWTGKLMFVDHMAAFGYLWQAANPTRTALRDVGLIYHEEAPTEDNGLGKMYNYQSSDPRVTFMSLFPIYQAKLFENQFTQNGIRSYGRSQHFHSVSREKSSPETYNGARMVQSTVIDMLANIMLGKLGTKAALYERAAPTVRDGRKRPIQLCWDCPERLLPFHVKPNPTPVCKVVDFLPRDVKPGEVWDGEMCPKWCMEESPVSQDETGSGLVDVRECDIKKTP